MNIKKKNIPVIILAGGLGTRLREETEFRPKPMVPIGGKPILWHIMKIYSSYGFHRFIICLGYKGEMIKEYFLNYKFQDCDITVNTATGNVIQHDVHNENWEVTLAFTGIESQTGSRVARIEKYIDTDHFMLTYGDGISNINIDTLFQFHLSHGKTATLSGVKLPFRFGNLMLDGNKVSSFKEKKEIEEQWINGGFFVFNRSFFNYLSTESSCILEQEPFAKAAYDKELMIYKHNGFWACMDTVFEQKKIENLWNTNPPWKVWGDTYTFKPVYKKNTYEKQ